MSEKFERVEAGTRLRRFVKKGLITILRNGQTIKLQTKFGGVLFVTSFVAIASFVTAASDWRKLPQTWYSLNGKQIVTFRHKKDAVWRAEIAGSDGSKVTWRTDARRPLSGLVSNHGESISILTGTSGSGIKDWQYIRKNRTLGH